MSGDLAPVEAPDTDEPAVQSDVTAELTAMRKLHAAVAQLDEAAQRRVLTWLFARYGIGEG